MPHENDAASRIALVTGGTDGIGKEIALGLARRGYQIVWSAVTRRKARMRRIFCSRTAR